MIIKQDGRYLIALHESCDLETISNMQHAMLEVLTAALTSDLWGVCSEGICDYTSLLSELLPTDAQMGKLNDEHIAKTYNPAILSN